MPSIKTRPCPSLFLEEIDAPRIQFTREDYQLRLDALVERMRQKGKTHVVIYGDREHFATMDYFSGYDCRFEEAVMVVDASGKVSFIVGNEGISQTYPIAYPVDVYLYQNFSLQGQPRAEQRPLPEIFRQIGLDGASSIGLVGYKYFLPQYIDTDPRYTFDVPAYILDVLCEVCDRLKVVNFTEEITGLPDGIRMQTRTAREIAWAEAAGNQSAGIVMRMLKKLKPGLSELDVTRGVAALDPVAVHPMVNFGAQKVRIGVSSPGNGRLTLGEVCGLCYGARGSLTSRVGIAAYDAGTVSDELRPHLDFYKALWHTVADLLGTLRVGASCAELHEIGLRHIGAPEYGLSLNVTHYTGADEWVNSPVYKDSPLTINDGAHIQVDVIASNPDPVRTAICEDSVVIAGPALRAALQAEYPQVHARILARQQAIREHLGIALHDDVLPMSNMTGVYFPYMLNLNEIFTLDA